MEVKTYKARNIQEALTLIRGDLGPEAAILHTRELRVGALWRLFPGMRRIEVTAALEVAVPSRLPTKPANAAKPAAGSMETQVLQIARTPESPTGQVRAGVPAAQPATRGLVDRDAAGLDLDGASRESFRQDVVGQLAALQSMVGELYRRTQLPTERIEIPESLFHIYAKLLDAEVEEATARELVDELRETTTTADRGDPLLLEARLKRLLVSAMSVEGAIQLVPGQCRVVALVGPTGVGKTTTLAKLAAQFRLREKRQVGLITVDTYRVAAVEQLRTYAEIIDLPMEVVSTPRDMRQAVARLSHLDLVLIDTAGRSPSDELKIQELKTFLGEAGAHEVHLVLSSVASAATLERTIRQFAPCGVSGLTLTKLDEAGGLGNVLPLVRGSRLPLRYLTDGQDVPDDIEPADATRFVERIFGGA